MGVVGLLAVPGTAWAQSATTGATAGSSVPRKLPGGEILPRTIPIFPLPDVMLFPNVSRPLHIFEPRYRAMMADALKGDRIIGMVLLRPGYDADYEGRPPIYPIGCAGVITDVEQLPDGRYAIVLRGLVKFRVTSEDQSRAYRLARVEAIPEMPDDKESAALRKQRPRLEALLAASIAPGSEPPPPELPDEDLVNGLAQYLAIDPIDRQALLELEGVLSRSQRLIDLLEKTVAPRR
jgi:Lon protease-like protein